MLTWLAWAVSLFIQNAVFTWVSRARNSGNIKYHWVASICSNGIWWVNQFVTVGLMYQAIKSHNIPLAVGAGIFYTICTSTGSVAMHWFLMKHVEKGNRKVGA